MSRARKFKFKRKNPYDKIYIKPSFPNNFFVLKNNLPFILTKITYDKKNNRTVYVGKSTNEIYSFYDTPINSCKIGINVVKTNSFKKNIKIKYEDINGKCFCAPIDDENFLLTPLLHTYSF